MIEFDLAAFASPDILGKLVSERIEGIDRIDILQIKVAHPFRQRTADEANDREIIQELASTLTLCRDRRDTRDIYAVARQDYRISDLSSYVVA